MKKLIFSAAALTVLFASCQKQDNTPATNTSGKTFKKAIIHMEDYKDGPMREYVDNGPKDYGCPRIGGNCAPQDIIINAPQISDMVGTIDRGANAGTFVRVNHDELSQTIPTKYLDGVVNGTLSLSMRGDVAAAYRCILFKDSKDAVVLAVPVVK